MARAHPDGGGGVRISLCGELAAEWDGETLLPLAAMKGETFDRLSA